MQIAWRSRGGVADTGSTTGDDRSQAQASTAAADRAARIAAADLATVELAQADPRASAPLYMRYAPVALNYCRRRIADPDAAADATSLIFTRAIAGLPSFRPDPARSGSTFRSWLFTIAHNVVIDTRRRHRPHVSLDRRMGAMGEASSGNPRWLTDPSASPEELAIRADDGERVQAMLRRLPERQRRVVELRIAGLTGAEIAQALGMMTSAVKSAQFRAYGTLRDLLHPEFHLPPETDDAQS